MGSMSKPPLQPQFSWGGGVSFSQGGNIRDTLSGAQTNKRVDKQTDEQMVIAPSRKATASYTQAYPLFCTCGQTTACMILNRE